MEQKKDMPPSSLFIALGYNKAGTDKKDRHYRRYYPDELEQVAEVIPHKPFHEEKVFRGSSKSKGGSWLAAILSKNANVEDMKQEVGYFKGLIKAYNKSDHLQSSVALKENNDLVMKMLQELYLKRTG